MKNFLNYIINTCFLKKFGYTISRTKKKLNIAGIDLEDDLILDRCLRYSMTPKLRMLALLNSINYVYDNNIQGDFVEAGVWKGGNLILFNILNKKRKSSKKIYGYDTFEGMPRPGQYDSKWGVSVEGKYNKKIKEGGWAKCTVDEVNKNILRECPSHNTILVKGKIEDTLLFEKNIPEKISILRLDTDFYTSTKIELEILFPRLEKDGILIIDDYGSYDGVRKAVDEYFKKKPTLFYVDRSCRLLIKK
jgi:O-methyltransferase